MNRWLYLLNITWMSFLGVFGAVVLSVAMPSVQGDLGINSTHSQWFSHAYLFGLFTAVPLSARIATRKGYKFAFFWGSFVYIAANGLICCFNSFYPIVICRLFAGLGVGILFPISLTMIASVFEKNRLSFAIALYMAIAFGGGIGSGFIIGGVFTDLFGWKSAMLFSTLIGIPSLLLTWWKFQETEKKPLPPYDWVGYLSFVGFLVAFDVLINNVKLPWNTEGARSFFTMITTTIGVVFFIIFLVNELKHERPLFVLSQFKIRAFAIGCLALFFVGSCLFGTASMFAKMLETNFHYSKSATGLFLAPSGFVIGIFGAASGLVNKWIHNRFLVMGGLLFIIVSCFMNHSITHLSSHSDLQMVLIIRSIGIGLSIGPTTALALSKLSKETVVRGAMTLTAIRQAGSSYGADLIELIAQLRVKFNSSVFGASLDANSAKYQEMLGRLKIQLMNRGYSPQDAIAGAEELIAKNGVNQAEILALNDGFFVLGILLSAALLAFVLAVLRALYLNRRALRSN